MSDLDVIIIGAGINGAGIARDAAMRGLKTLLVDKGDIGGGTSAWSSRLIHGGLRYLEHGEISLVRESLRERECLMRIAPHLVTPFQLYIPIYKSGRRGRFTIRAGMIAYDLLSFDKSLARHRILSRDETLRLLPGLEQDGLVGAATYFDAHVEFAERLVLENALSAAENGATVLSYSRVNRLMVEGDTVKGVELEDVLDGTSRSVFGSLTINVAGPWVDDILEASDQQTQRLIGGTKGSHIVVERFSGAPEFALYVEALSDGRPFFILPWNGRYLIGTTDLKEFGDLDRLTADDNEIDYLIEESNRVIPSASLTRESVLYSYAGVRPLPYVSNMHAASLTRRHFIHDHSPSLDNLISIVGGKLTTYRSLAEQTVNLVFRKMGRKSPHCLTKDTVLPGAKSASDLSPRSGRQSKAWGGASDALSPRSGQQHKAWGDASDALSPRSGRQSKARGDASDALSPRSGRQSKARGDASDALSPRSGRQSKARDDASDALSPRSGRQHKAWGDASEASGTPGKDAINYSEPAVAGDGSRGVLSEPSLAHLLKVYGKRAREIIALIEIEPRLATVFDDETGAIAAEIVFAFRNEMARTLADCLLRRTMVGLNSKAGVGADEAAAEIACEHLGWSAERATREVADYRKYIKRFRPANLK